VVVESGEAMLALWGALKSVCTGQSRVLCVSNGIYGFGFQEMAQAIGTELLC
jgi:aspartate aminotransferase-like enzyme